MWEGTVDKFRKSHIVYERNCHIFIIVYLILIIIVSRCIFCPLLFPVVEYRRATMLHKSLNRTAPDYMKEMFKFVTDVSQRQTRFVNNSKLVLPTGNNLKVFTYSFQYAASAVWNKLPVAVHVREAESTSPFQSAYIKCFLTGLEYKGF